MSTAAFSEIAVSWYPRETEASILAELLRLSRLTVLYGEAGAGKTALLKNGVLPRLRRRATDRDLKVVPESPKALAFPDRRSAAERAREVAIFFDEWNEAPLAALEVRIRGALPASRKRTAQPASSMAMNLAAWNKEFGVRFLIIFDAFEKYLAASRDAPGIRIFDAQFAEVLKDDNLPANFLLALRDERPLLERFEGRIARLGDTSVRLPSWHRSVGSLHENEHGAEPPAAAVPDLGDATAPAVRPIPDSGLHTIIGASQLSDGASPVPKEALELRSPSPLVTAEAESNSRTGPRVSEVAERATSEVEESQPPVLEVVAFELVQSPSPVATAEPESNSRPAPRVSEVADRATFEVGESQPPVLEVIAESDSHSGPAAIELVPPPPIVTAEPESNSRTAPPAPHALSAQNWWANSVRLWRANSARLNWRAKLAWVALPLIGISLLLIVLAPPQPPSQVANVLTNPKPPSQVVNVRTNPEPPSEVARAPAAPQRSTAAATAGGGSEIARLTARANALLAQGDIASARIVLERAVDLGSAKAAFALAETYDPIVLHAWRTFGTLGDVARAKQLYAKAKAGGVQEAQDRLNALRE